MKGAGMAKVPVDLKQGRHKFKRGGDAVTMEKRLLGIEELSQYLGIRPQTIRNRLSGGTFPIPAKKVCGRVKFDRKDVDSYLDKLKPHG